MTSYLLDTHTVIWWLDEPERLRRDARVEIANPRNSVFFSAVSMFEIATKEAKGSLKFSADFRERLAGCRFSGLAVTLDHADGVRFLPLHHKDPFDRLLVSQALVEGLTIITSDTMLAKYDVPVLAA
jgi:PIN domain nuclease of toxin-antitoxin system